MPKEAHKTINEYIAKFPKNIQNILEEEISYQMPTFKLNGNLVWFAAFKKHIGFYPKHSAIEAFRKELTDYEVSKGTIRFPLDKPIPFDLVRKIVKYRVKQNLEKKQT